MGKRTNKATTTKATTNTNPAGAAGATAQAATVLHMAVKAGGKFRGARQAWYDRALQYNGKPVAEFLQSCKEAPPSLPKSGVAEAPQGWLSFYQRTGIVELVPAQ